MNYSFSSFRKVSLLSLCTLLFSLSACAQKQETKKVKPLASNNVSNSMNDNPNKTIDTVIFGAGCFWCVEAVFQQLKGVKSVTSGYMGGQTQDPTYKQVCTGMTGHAEVAQIVYDPQIISYTELLEAFWSSHDPTTLNRQGADRGTQYRSVIFYENDYQKDLAEKYKKELDASGAFQNPIVTEISPISTFYKAENYHQNYYNQNSEEPYCQIVIAPKLEKFKKVFQDKLKQ
ncbi:peptide-methionine (S)-S-oxide reductase MsrA [Solitalea canadensis]|uniref:Peptide methionine sulfoxide reductase MsrA n=1 Tax=Solitalea canadensis (strain ATCC 29591 / DSM 3403 / JCM 21819 / LMG 8368 / NBRC 15130 / NCIMB 12057 / USAM 9D) TaxID=929556 RepID=H8KVI5_SOLCM|nr:peptide-methionine (S)-S-oxide reductase MsrA [Solitalea canadensis]AFD06488.1 methionine-S-sulfoxide reductase [Solitalea canadensis DSM 3403]